jgi:hypothetical protein
VRYYGNQTHELAGLSSVNTLIRAFAGLLILARFKVVPFSPCVERAIAHLENRFADLAFVFAPSLFLGRSFLCVRYHRCMPGIICDTLFFNFAVFILTVVGNGYRGVAVVFSAE